MSVARSWQPPRRGFLPTVSLRTCLDLDRTPKPGVLDHPPDDPIVDEAIARHASAKAETDLCQAAGQHQQALDAQFRAELDPSGGSTRSGTHAPPPRRSPWIRQRKAQSARPACPSRPAAPPPRQLRPAFRAGSLERGSHSKGWQKGVPGMQRRRHAGADCRHLVRVARSPRLRAHPRRRCGRDRCSAVRRQGCEPLRPCDSRTDHYDPDTRRCDP